MNKTQKGSVNIILIAVIVILLGVIGYLAFPSKSDVSVVGDSQVTTFQVSKDSAKESEQTAPEPSMTLVYPKGGEVWKIGQTYKISFTTTADLGPVAINLVQYSDDSVEISSRLIGTTNTNNFSYKVPAGIEITRDRASRYKVEVYPESARELLNRSSDYFSIVE